MKIPAPFFPVALLLLFAAPILRAQTVNLIPNPDFSAAAGNPFKGWRIDFPYEGPYVKNAGYVKICPTNPHAVEITIPKAVAENEGGKIESAFIKVEPGTLTYHGSVDCMTGDLSAKIYVEAWALDPTPPGQPDKFRVPAREGMPALVNVYRAQFPDPPAQSKVWTTVRRDVKLPEKIIVAGKPSQVSYVTMKVFAYSATTATVPMAKSDFTRFLLTAAK